MPTVLTIGTPANGGTIDLTKDMAILNGPLSVPTVTSKKTVPASAYFNYNLRKGTSGQVLYICPGTGLTYIRVIGSECSFKMSGYDSTASINLSNAQVLVYNNGVWYVL